MSLSNKYRKVNKIDGPKKRGKKAMRKSRRVDSKKITLTETDFTDYPAASVWKGFGSFE